MVIGGISGTLRRKGQGECCGYYEAFYVVAPPVSVMDRAVGTCEQVLNVLIVCRWYEPGNPSSMAVLGEKLGGRPADHSAGLRVVSAALFLGSSRVRPMLLVACERLPRTGTARRKRMSGIHGLAWKAYVSCWSGFSLQGVHRFESSRLWDMSNCLFVAAIK
jgi:hypothetical protein